MSLGATLRRFKTERVQALPTRIIQETVREFSDQLVTVWSPYGNPELWKSPPPADYKPGNFRSSWFFTIGAPTGATTDATDKTEPNGIGALSGAKAGDALYLSNNAPHASAIEAGHSRQALQGVLPNAIEFEGIAYNVTRRLAG